MATCQTSLSGNILNDCTEVIGAGVRNTAWIIPLSAIATVARTGNIVSALTLKEGAKAFSAFMPGSTPFTGTNTSGDGDASLISYNKVVSMMLYANTPNNSENIKALCDNPHAVVLELKSQDPTQSAGFVVIGLEQGAYGANPSWNIYENKGAWTIEMTETGAPTPQVFFWSGEDAATTRAALNSLLQ